MVKKNIERYEYMVFNLWLCRLYSLNKLYILTEILSCFGIQDAKLFRLFLEMLHSVISLIFHVFLHWKKNNIFKIKVNLFEMKCNIKLLYIMVFNQNDTLTAFSPEEKK